jgi:hypothetical protein
MIYEYDEHTKSINLQWLYDHRVGSSSPLNVIEFIKASLVLDKNWKCIEITEDWISFENKEINNEKHVQKRN